MSAAEIWLSRIEDRLRLELEQGDTPFLGLYSDLFNESTREYFKDKVLSPTSPVLSFIGGLNKWPATFSTYLTIHVVEGYGRSGTAEVYPFITDALGIDDSSLSQPIREKLWKSYRKACSKLGLSVVPAGSSARPFVDEYLRQAGVPIKYVPQLIEKFEKQASRLGVPELDDPDALHLWQEQLLPSLGTPLSKTISRAIENDETAFYANVYLRVLNYAGESECTSETERTIYEALATGSVRRVRMAATIPEVQWRNGEIGVLVPASPGVIWSIQTYTDDDDRPIGLKVEAGAEVQYVSLPDHFLLKISVHSTKSEFEFPIWSDLLDNKVLIFGRSGRLIAKSSLGGASIKLLPGSYTLVSRWLPEEQDLEAIQVTTQPAVFESCVTLAAGEDLLLRRGPAELLIQGKSVAAMDWSGNSKIGVLGREMFVGEGLTIRGSIPHEMAEVASDGFEIVVSVRGSDDKTILPVALTDGTSFELQMNQVLNLVPYGLRRFTAFLRRKDIPNRSLTRISGLIWKGLASTDGIRFKCVSNEAFSKSNLERGSCENIRFTDDGFTFRDDEQRHFRSVFRITVNETVAFTWLVPGIFLSLGEIRESEFVERSIGREATVQVHPGSRTALIVYSTYEGSLRLGNYRKEIGSSAMGGVRVYLAPLLEHITPDCRTIEFVSNESDISINLLQIVTPHQALRFQADCVADQYRVSFDVKGHFTEVSLDAVEVGSGRRDTFSLPVDVLDAATGTAMEKVWVLSKLVGADLTRIEITWSLNDWQDGAYIFRIRGEIDGRWGELVNARGDIFLGSTIIGRSLHNPLGSIEELADTERLDIFRRLTELLLECYAIESWQDAKWLSDEWERIADSFKIDNIPVLIGTAILALRRAPDHAPDSWVPLMVIAARLIQIFAQPSGMYSRLPQGELRELQLLSSLADFDPSDRKNFERDDFLAVFVMFGFANGNLVSRSKAERLEGFSLKLCRQLGGMIGEEEYRRIRRSEDWAPSPGLFLGARHYWWAVRNLETGFTAGEEGNDFRKGHALKLATRLVNGGITSVLPVGARSFFDDYLSLGAMDFIGSEEGDNQQRENTLSIIDVISVTAFVARLAARRSDVQKSFETNMAVLLDESVETLGKVMGYILYLGMDLFLFYLLLWELVISRDLDEVEIRE